MQRLASAALIALTGCAPLAYTDVTGQKRSSDVFAIDSGQCQTGARNVAAAAQGSGAGDTGLASSARFTGPPQQKAFDSCMRSKGWAS